MSRPIKIEFRHGLGQALGMQLLFMVGLVVLTLLVSDMSPANENEPVASAEVAATASTI